MRRLFAAASLSSAAILLSPLAAQVGPDRALVAARAAGPGATSLFEVDLTGGGIVPLGRFPSDQMPPRAMRLDPNSRDAFVALDAGATTPVVRLSFRGLQVRSERTVGVVPGAVTDFTFGGRDELLLTVGGGQGGLWALPRNGGGARFVVSLPRATAVSNSGYAGVPVIVVQSGAAPATDPQIHRVDPATGQLIPHQVPMQGYRPFAITGHIELGTAIGHNIFANADGTLAVGYVGQTPLPLQMVPVLPAGGTARLRGVMGYPPTVLGNRADPFIRRIHNLAPGQQHTWNVIAGPLPGDPIDFDLAPSALAHVEPFGETCGTGNGITMFEASRPSIGNTQFSLRATGATPSSTILLALGISDSTFAGMTLPLVFPGGCRLLVSAEAVVPTTTDGSGFAVLTVPVPNVPALAGGVFYGQWVQQQAALATSNAIAGFPGS